MSKMCDDYIDPLSSEVIIMPKSDEERTFNIVKGQLENGCICFSDTHNKKEMDFIRKLVDKYKKEKEK